MIHKGVAGILLTACMAVWPAMTLAITCDECRELDKSKVSLERDISQKESSLQAAYDKKKYTEVNEIRKQILDLRKDLFEMQKKEGGCKDACRSDVVKEAECNRIRSQIVKIEEDAPGEVEKADALYRELAICNKDLEKLKKSR